MKCTSFCIVGETAWSSCSNNHVNNLDLKCLNDKVISSINLNEVWNITKVQQYRVVQKKFMM